MIAFTWSPKYETHLDLVDQQHEELVRISNALIHYAFDHDNTSLSINDTLQKLTECALYHFAEEERLMIETQVDPRHSLRHIEKHNLFKDTINQFTESLSHPHTTSSSKEALISLLEYLVQWLSSHIICEDKLMAEQIIAINRGISPENAYIESIKRFGSTSKALLQVIENLLELFVAKHHKIQNANRILEEAVRARTFELEELNKELDKLAYTDSLTGIANRRSALIKLEACVERHVKNGQDFICMMFDVDNFKTINDTYGHAHGDHTLKVLTEKVQSILHEGEDFFRLSGDEFLVIVQGIKLQEGLVFAERIRTAIASIFIDENFSEHTLSVSIGVTEGNKTDDSTSKVLKKADMALYKAKGHGKNCVCFL